MTRFTRPLALLIACASTASAGDPGPAELTWDAQVSTATAAGYCLAKHPYKGLASEITGGYTRDGYEVVASPGIVGAVRRNFIYDRTTDARDEGSENSCARACSEFGRFYARTGLALHRKVEREEQPEDSGLGDLGALVVTDLDPQLKARVPSGVWSRGSSFHGSGVARADYCCCQATGKLPRPVEPALPDGVDHPTE